MKCPYCGNEMELGLIAKYSLKSFVEGCAVKAFLCRSCKKVIIDYGKKTDMGKK